MSDEGDRACPLCAEEMDLTDQQLKPCKCGYEICVWCWHHIMNMAEKDQTQGRCPACRSPYNKEKIVGTTSKCERLVAEMNMEKKMKSQKAKSKISDGRKQLANVRVIQKNLVYIVGLPLTLADEKLLQQRDYFGQYGRVLKVSISRTAAGSIQQFANSTCSVYITYSKEEEAFRCIQSVHGFILDDRPLKACFGTTKYCHAWLRNMPCSNPDCLYLHEIGSQEDSFSKDDVASAYTRDRFQQITGATSNMQPRSGNVLPPPADECHISSSTLTGKPMSKSASNNLATSGNGSPPNSSCDRSTALPSAASWVARASNGNPPSGDIVCSNGPSKQKPETCSASATFSTAVAATLEASRLHAETRKKLIDNKENHNKSHKSGQVPPKNRCTVKADAQESPVVIHSPPSPKDKGRCVSSATVETTSMELAERSCNPCPENNLNVSAQGNINFSTIESKNITKFLGLDYFEDNRSNSSFSGNIANSSLNQGLQQYCLEELIEPSTSIPPGKTIAFTYDSRVAKEQCGLGPEFNAGRLSVSEPDLQNIGANSDSQVTIPRMSEDLQSLEGKKLNDSDLVSSTSYFSASSLSLYHSTFSAVHSPTQTEPYSSSRSIPDPPIVDSNIDNGLLLRPPGISEVLNGCPGNVVNDYVDSDRKFEHANLINKLIDRFEGESTNVEQSVTADIGESNIISNILSLDFDPWEESLTHPNLVKLLMEGDKRQGPLTPSNSSKMQNSNKSRFSFARPDEHRDLPFSIEPSFGHMQQVLKEGPLRHDFAVNRDLHFDKFGDCSGFSTFNKEPENLAGSYSNIPSNKLSGGVVRGQIFTCEVKGQVPGCSRISNSNRILVATTHFDDKNGNITITSRRVSRSRSQVSAPPGFSAPNKAPPPGFTLHERVGPNFDSISGNHFLDVSSLLRSPYQTPPIGNISSTDIEFMDPAILAVGVGQIPNGLNSGGLDMGSSFSPQLNTVENEVRLQSLMQRLSPPVQNQSHAGMHNFFGPRNDTRNHLASRIMEQTLASNLSPFLQLSLQQPRTSMMPNGQWNGWNEGKSASDMGIAELLRTESLGFNKLYGGYEDSKFCMPSSGDIYNRTYGI